MTDVQLEELNRYFRPVYFVEFEEMAGGELFPKTYRIGYYSPSAKKDATVIFNRNPCAKKVIEKSMYTGKEKVLRQRTEFSEVKAADNMTA